MMTQQFAVPAGAPYVLGRSSQFAMSPPSPLSPVTFADEDDLCTPINELSLDMVASTAAAAGKIQPLPLQQPTLPPSRTGSSSWTGTESESASVSSDSVRHRPSLPSPITTAPASMPGSPCLLPMAAHSDAAAAARLAGALHVLNTEAAALQAVSKLYTSSPHACTGFHQAVEVILQTQSTYPAGKLVVIGVGKSGHIGRKLAATFNSLAVPSSFVHPTEALHGDLGHIRPHDALLFITYSGKTQELVSLLPHIDAHLPLIILTSHITPETCALVQHRETYHRDAATVGPTILLPAPVHEEEKVSFGVSAPTTSTTTALAVGDALAIVTSQELHASIGGVAPVFQRNHPGGAIGEASAKRGSLADPAGAVDTMRHLAVPWHEIPVVQAEANGDALGAGGDVLCGDVLRAGYNNVTTKGWVRVVTASVGSEDALGDAVALPSRMRTLSSTDLARPAAEVAGLVVGRADFIVVAADTKASSAADWLRQSPAGATDAVLAIVDHGKEGGSELVGVLELKDLLQAH